MRDKGAPPERVPWHWATRAKDYYGSQTHALNDRWLATTIMNIDCGCYESSATSILKRAPKLGDLGQCVCFCGKCCGQFTIYANHRTILSGEILRVRYWFDKMSEKSCKVIRAWIHLDRQWSGPHWALVASDGLLLNIMIAWGLASLRVSPVAWVIVVLVIVVVVDWHWKKIEKE